MLIRKVGLLLFLAVLVGGVFTFAQTAVTPRVLEGGVLLFDNGSGATATKLSIIFDGEVALTTSDFMAVGGGEATLVAGYQTFVFVDVEVVAGGTVQLTLPADYANVQVAAAYFFE